MTWLAFGIAVLACGVLIVVPGAVVLRAASAPGWVAIVFAPVVSAALVGALAIGYAIVGLRFDVGTFVAGVVSLAAAVALIARRRRAGAGEWSQSGWTWGAWAALGIGMAATLAVWSVEWAARLGRPDAFGKGYDIPWHLSIVQWMQVTGDASSLDAGHVVPTLGSGFYPSTWHALVLLVHQCSPATVVGSASATILGVMAVAWPLSMVGLVVVLIGRSWSAVLLGALLSSAFVAFPYWFVAHGGLYANQYADAVLPALVAATVAVGRGLFPARRGLVLVIVAFVGCAIAQTNSVFTAAVLISPFGLSWLHRRLRPISVRLAYSAPVAAVVVATAAWVGVERLPVMHRTFIVDWPAFATTPQAIWQALFGGYLAVSTTWWTAIPVFIGMVAAVRTARCLLASHLLISTMYVLVASRGVKADLPWLRTYATGYWYHDSERLAAACVVTAVPLAVLGLITAGRAVTRLVGTRSAAMLVPAVGLTVLVAALSSAAMDGRAYLLEQDAPLRAIGAEPFSTITTEKVAFLQRAAMLVGDHAVANDPYDGSAYAYALTGMDVYFKAYPGNWMGRPSPDMRLIGARLSFVASDPAICPVLRRNGVEYVLQMVRTGGFFGGGPTPMDAPRGIFSGIVVRPGTPGFRLILGAPGLRLFRITACG